MEDSVVKVGGRLSNASMPGKAKYHVILPKNSLVSRLILEDIHRNLMHSGRNHMIAKLRQRYWIVNANSAARKGYSHRDGRSLDTESCINAIRRFIARRGQVVKLRSDNRTNFVATEKELKLAFRSIDQDRIQQMLAKRGIDWEFSTPSAPHQGGVWERQIQTVKRKLKVVFKEQCLNDEGLCTLLCEVEAVVNDRPLTRASDDPNDLDVLTPNDLLLLKKQPFMPVGTFDRDDLYARRRWIQVQFLAELFWKRWLQEYLPLLQTRQKRLAPRRNIVPGDICLVVDQNSPRGVWQLASGGDLPGQERIRQTSKVADSKSIDSGAASAEAVPSVRDGQSTEGLGHYNIHVVVNRALLQC
ncbi:uncharacterized protein LOC135494280 [Lineus longissimus]|uniref:uncharacterized protein LOC135494280 n=1 Tax=Lineus longissimus TaxID=88925 RepID=UPI00315DC94E